MKDENEKVRERRLRRKAARMGYRLLRSRRRDPHAIDYGLYALVDTTTGFPVNPSSVVNTIYSWDLEAVAQCLRKLDGDDDETVIDHAREMAAKAGDSAYHDVMRQQLLGIRSPTEEQLEQAREIAREVSDEARNVAYPDALVWARNGAMKEQVGRPWQERVFDLLRSPPPPAPSVR